MKDEKINEFVLWYMKKHGYEKTAEKLSKAKKVKIDQNSEHFDKFEKFALKKQKREKVLENPEIMQKIG